MNIFIDCGWFKGLGWSLFKKTKEYKEDFICYAIDPCCYETDKSENVIYIKKVAYIYDGTIEFHKSHRKGGRANGIYKNPNAKNDEIETVECMDFSMFVKNNFNEKDFIVCKMDIENSENDVLEKMMNDNTIGLINILYLEAHNKNDKYKRVMEHIRANKLLEKRSAIEICYQKYI